MATDIEATLTRALAQEGPELIAAYLFGSEARGTAHATSDVDVALLFEAGPRPTLEGQPFDLQDRLERALGRTLDLLVLNQAPPDLVHRVLRDGRLVLDRSPSARIRFEVHARNEYFDLLPHLERYRKAALRSER